MGTVDGAFEFKLNAFLSKIGRRPVEQMSRNVQPRQTCSWFIRWSRARFPLRCSGGLASINNLDRRRLRSGPARQRSDAIDVRR